MIMGLEAFRSWEPKTCKYFLANVATTTLGSETWGTSSIWGFQLLPGGCGS